MQLGGLTHSLTCDGVIMVGGVGERLQQVGLVLKGVADLSFKVLKAGDEMVECVLSIGVVQHTAGWDLQPAVAEISGSDPITLCCFCHRLLLQRQHLRAEEDISGPPRSTVLTSPTAPAEPELQGDGLGRHILLNSPDGADVAG